MQRSRRQPFLSPDHMGDAHQMVIYNISEMIGGHAIRLHQYFIIKCIGMHQYPASDHIIEPHFFFTGNFHPYHVRFTGGQRSEERRVGKECSYWWGPDRSQKKSNGQEEEA